jgi:uncharacterized protein (TIGR03067 family)
MFTTCLGLAIVVGAPGIKDVKKPEPPSVVGEYVLESRTQGGKPIGGKSQHDTIELTADGGFNFKKDKEVIAGGTFKVDPAKNPSEFDLSLVEGQKPMPGIYKIEKDTLTICYSLDGTRPTKFESPVASQISVWTLKRVAAKKD